MILNKIKLENIRSYVSEEIEFPEGSVLLSGDIGSGKSSVLLAVEFALFGLEKGSGTRLLRNGQNFGSVELYFELDGKEVIIKRSLRRGKSVSQDAGYIIVEGMKREGTATELKARVLGLLNYPKDYLTKTKGLLYKYTVYTPQEEMKRILVEGRDERLHVLRKVFDIDKYKRIQENSGVFIKYLRGEMRVYEERLKDLDVKLEEKKEKEREIKEEKKEFEGAEKELKIVRKKLEGKKEDLRIFESKIKELNLLKNKVALVENNYNHKVEEGERIKERIENLRKEIKEEKEEDFEMLKLKNINEIEQINKNILDVESKLEDVRGRLSGFRAKESQAGEIKEKIRDLEKCPTCYQEVEEEYKERIFKNQDVLISKFRKEIEVLSKEEEEGRNSLMKNREMVEKVRKELNEIELRKVEFENNLKMKKELGKNEEELRNVEKIVSKLEMDKKNLDEEFAKIKDVEEEYREVKLELDEILSKEKEGEVKKSSSEEKIRFFVESMSKLDEEIEKLSKIQIKLGTVKKMEAFLDKHFLKLMGVIEKSVMSRLHGEFNELFQKWFGIIVGVGSESLSVGLDEEFTPVINQEEYEMEYSDLSGGERTAVALAYRLSLNQVINNLVGEVKTRDLLILDEPTDGFSNEQLDRVRVVLDELEIRQVIIVSHEAKVESFVDKVLKFEKKEGVSGVVG